jgi:hypothetical protein
MSEPSSIPVAPPPRPSSGRRIFGIIVMLLGIAMTVISGLCTTVFMVNDMTTSSGGGGDINLSGIEFIVGGPFILVGALMWWGGARLKRPRPNPKQDVAVFSDPPPPVDGTPGA